MNMFMRGLGESENIGLESRRRRIGKGLADALIGGGGREAQAKGGSERWTSGELADRG
jgi:hypothetical protein